MKKFLSIFVVLISSAASGTLFTVNVSTSITYSHQIAAISIHSNTPVATLPSGITTSDGGRTYQGTVMDTTYSLPTGTLWTPVDSAALTTVLASVAPGDVIQLHAGTVYSGSFTLPALSNPTHKWIYIISDAYASLPAPGHRVGTGDAVNMPKIVGAGSGVPAINNQSVGGANYWRFVGIEGYQASTSGCNPTHMPWPINCYSNYWGIWGDADHIVFDRSYIHGDDATQDILHGLGFINVSPAIGSSYIAVIDSRIDSIHGANQDSQTIIGFCSPGPFKINNNYLSASTEDVMFGGSGNCTVQHQQNIEMQHNLLTKPDSWIARSTGSGPEWCIKDNFELKDGRYVLVYGNQMENVWFANCSSGGENIRLTTRTSQSGDGGVVDDVTISANYFRKANRLSNALGTDNVCSAAGGYPLCQNQGESQRVVFMWNLGEERDQSLPAGFNITGSLIWSEGVSSWLLHHNTFVGTNATNNEMKYGEYFNLTSGCIMNPIDPTNNLWMQDNVLTGQVSSDCGLGGNSGLAVWFILPSSPDYNTRFYGNVQYVSSTQSAHTWPAHNVTNATASPISFVNPVEFVNGGNWELTTPDTDTSDGLASGYSQNVLKAALNQSTLGTVINGAKLSGGTLH